MQCSTRSSFERHLDFYLILLNPTLLRQSPLQSTFLRSRISRDTAAQVDANTAMAVSSLDSLLLVLGRYLVHNDNLKGLIFQISHRLIPPHNCSPILFPCHNFLLGVVVVILYRLVVRPIYCYPIHHQYG